jgi:hypothetical protein
MKIMDAFLAALPAEVDELATADIKKVDDPSLQIPKETAGFIDPQDIFLEGKDEGFEFGRLFDVFFAFPALIVVDASAGDQVENEQLVVPLLHLLLFREKLIEKVFQSGNKSACFL